MLGVAALLSLPLLGALAGEQLNGNTITVPLTVDTGQEVQQQDVRVANLTSALTVLNRSYPIKARLTQQGTFITAIDGVEANSTHAWLYFVNGELASTSASMALLTGDDNVTFRYMDLDRARQLVG